MKPEDWVKKNSIGLGFPLIYKDTLVYYKGFDSMHVIVQYGGYVLYAPVKEFSIFEHDDAAVLIWMKKRNLRSGEGITLQHLPKVGDAYGSYTCTVPKDTPVLRIFTFMYIGSDSYHFLRVRDSVSGNEFWAPFYLFATIAELKTTSEKKIDVLHFYYSTSFHTICEQLKSLIPNVKIKYVIGIYECSQTKFEKKWDDFKQMHVFYKMSTNELIFSNTAKKDAIWNVPTHPCKDNWTRFKSMIIDSFKTTSDSTPSTFKTSTTKVPILKIEEKMFQEKPSVKKTKPLGW